MKKASLLFALLMIFGMNAFAQMHVSTMLREDFDWDEATQKWVLTPTKNDQEKTVFDFEKDWAAFKHTTPSDTLAYAITNPKLHEDSNIMEFDVTSDTGNKYRVTIDPKGRNIQFVGQREGKMCMVRHTIRKIWKGE